jgi:hypothetical protein
MTLPPLPPEATAPKPSAPGKEGCEKPENAVKINTAIKAMQRNFEIEGKSDIFEIWISDRYKEL